MCGLVGIGSSDPQHNRTWLSQAIESIAYRGPDDVGTWWSEDHCVGLGHRRLSILDLSPLGHQPMLGDFGRIAMVFNGEIYNFLELKKELESLGVGFKSNTDTEVLLEAYKMWGHACLDKLDGMFAFAIYDKKLEEIFLARDRVGEKPLFFRIYERTIQFASELKALLKNPENPRKIDLEALDSYLAFGYVSSSYCILKGYNKLRPAHAMRFNLKTGHAHIWRYWHIPDFIDNPQQNDLETLVRECEVLLSESVKRQLIADVPVGILLSGGVDSSLIAAMAVRHSTQVRTFSVGFPGDSTLDETKHARLIANHFSTHHTELMMQPTELDFFSELSKHLDEPMADSSLIPTFLVSKLVREHCVVALGGDGGDELFGGYGHYSNALKAEKRLRFVPHFLLKFLGFMAEACLPVGKRGRYFFQQLSMDPIHGLPKAAYFFDPRTRKKLLAPFVSDYISVAEKIEMSLIPQSLDIIRRGTLVDFHSYLPDDILVKVDRMSMLNSLEMRAPFLSRSMIEFTFSKVPSILKTTETQKKILLKELCKRTLPLNFDLNRKQGFSIPLNKWVKSGLLTEVFEDVLGSKDSIFDKKVVKQLLTGQARGYCNADRIFNLVLFEYWRQAYNITL